MKYCKEIAKPPKVTTLTTYNIFTLSYYFVTIYVEESRLKYSLKIGKWLSEARILDNRSKIQTSPFTVSNKAISDKSRRTIRKNIDKFFPECTKVLSEFSLMEYPGDDIDFNLDFFSKLQAEFVEAKQNDRLKQEASNKKKIDELRTRTPGHGTSSSSAFMAGDNCVNRVKNILSAVKFTNKTNNATPPIDNGIQSIPSTKTSGIAYSSSPTVPTIYRGSSDSFVDDERSKLQDEVIKLLKNSSSYVSTDTFENVKTNVLELFGDINLLNTSNIVWLPKKLFISDPPVLKLVQTKMFNAAKFEFDTTE